MTKLYPWADLTARIFLAILFLVAGFNKIPGYEGTAGYMQSMGVPGMLLPAVIALEILGGLAIAVGFRIRLAAFLLGGFTLLSALIFHNPLIDPGEQISFMKNLAIAGGFLLLSVHGAGRLSLDARRGR